MEEDFINSLVAIDCIKKIPDKTDMTDAPSQ